MAILIILIRFSELNSKMPEIPSPPPPPPSAPSLLPSRAVASRARSPAAGVAGPCSAAGMRARQPGRHARREARRPPARRGSRRPIAARLARLLTVGRAAHQLASVWGRARGVSGACAHALARSRGGAAAVALARAAGRIPRRGIGGDVRLGRSRDGASAAMRGWADPAAGRSDPLPCSLSRRGGATDALAAVSPASGIGSHGGAASGQGVRGRQGGQGVRGRVGGERPQRREEGGRRGSTRSGAAAQGCHGAGVLLPRVAR